MSSAQTAPIPADPIAAFERAQAEAKHWLERFRAEAEFATALAVALPEESKGWSALIERARATVADAATADLGALKAAVVAAERELTPIATIAKTFAITCVGHAHIDMNWLWGWHETVATTIDTFETVLALMDEFPDFVYIQSQASVYQIVLEHHPEMFARIQARVTQGRWEVVAAHWVEGDRNMASGESLCRHLLYTRAFMKKHFNLNPEDITVDWSPDTFGHAHTLPSIDARGGVKHYYMCRSGDSERPAVFWWEGPDGQRVLVNKEILWYNSEVRPASAGKLLEFHKKTGSREWLQVFGVGDHGGGPTRRDLTWVGEMNAWPVYPRVRFGTVKGFFKHLETLTGLPVLKQELNYEFAGCYTTQTSIKKNNRVGEALMSEADAIAAIARAAIGRAVPAETIAQGWRDVLFSHFHDILPGSGVRQTREYNSAMFQKIQAAGGQVRTQTLRALVRAIDTSSGGAFAGGSPGRLTEHVSVALGAGAGRSAGDVSLACVVADGPRAAVVFNPTGWSRSEVVRSTVWDLDTGPNARPMHERSYQARYADGTVVAAQRVGQGHYWGHSFVDLAFPATVGAYGWTTVSIEEGGPPPGAWKAWSKKENESGVNLPTGTMELENELIKVTFDRRTGGIVGLLHKASGSQLADPRNPMGVLEYIHERPVGMSAWILGDVQFRRECEVESMDITSGGPHVATLVAKVKVTNDSRFTVTYEVAAGSPAVSVTVDGGWLERGSNQIGIPRLAFKVPTLMAAPQARYEIPYGSIARDEPSGREVPAQRWAHLSGSADGRPCGLTVLNDSKYGHSLDGSTLRINIVRSSYEPDGLPEIGQQTARFALVARGPEVSVAEATRDGAAFNHPLHSLIAPIHGGNLPAAAETVTADGALLTQIKWSEDGQSLVVRLLETTGKAATARVSIDAKVLGAASSATATDVLERPSANEQAHIAGGVVEVPMAAHAIATVAITLGKVR